MVGYNDCLIIIGFRCLDDILYAVVHCMHCLSNGIVYTCVTYHITIGAVDYDEVLLLCIDGTYQLFLYFISTHLRFQVVSSHLGRWYQDTVLTLIRSLATTIEEEGDVCILFCLGSVQLLLAVLAQVFAQRIFHILFREENMHALEVGIIRSHTVVL